MTAADSNIRILTQRHMKIIPTEAKTFSPPFRSCAYNLMLKYDGNRILALRHCSIISARKAKTL